MRTFDVYKHPIKGYEAVKQGFSWPGFFFVWIWALIKKMWWCAVFILAVDLLLITIENALFQAGFAASASVLILARLGLYVFIGAEGNQWRKNNLLDRGYKKIGTAEASSPDDATGRVAERI